jgi:hypothetical protein
MREFTIRRGTFIGTHIIYDSIKEANENGIYDIKSPWYSRDLEAGDWVKADDGYICQCLRRYQVVNKRHKSGQYTDCFQFPQGLFYVYYDKKGNPNIKSFYGALTRPKRTQIGDSLSEGKYMNARKRLFVTLVAEGTNPYTAVVLAFNKHTAPSGLIHNLLKRLLQDEQIKEELMEALKPFASQIELRILELSKGKYENLNDFFIDKTARLLMKVNSSTTAELAVLQFGMKFLGRHINIVMPSPSSSNNKEIQNAEFKEITPPSLGPYKPQFTAPLARAA